MTGENEFGFKKTRSKKRQSCKLNIAREKTRNWVRHFIPFTDLEKALPGIKCSLYC